MELKIITKPFKGRPVGSVMDMNPSQAKLLVKIGRAQYLTRDMQAASPTVDVPVLLPAEVEPEVHLEPEVPAEPETFAPVAPVAPVVQDEPEAPAEHAEPEEAPKRRVRLTRKAQAEE